MIEQRDISKVLIALGQCVQAMPIRVAYNSKNPHLKNEYADLGAVLDVVKPVMKEFGLSFTQFPINDVDGRVGIKTIIIHLETGQYLEQQVLIPLDPNKGINNSQGTGVINTYLRRYSLNAIFGLFADKDGDGYTPESNTNSGYSDTIIGYITPKYAPTDRVADEMLVGSVLPKNASQAVVQSWAKYYMARHDEVGNHSDAVKFANDKYTQAMNARKKS